MKKLIANSILMLLFVFGGALVSAAEATNNKPPRPDRIEETLPEKPSEYHTWNSGKWKWSRKSEDWEWQSGYWRFDHDLYAFKNRWRYSNVYRPWRYMAIPLGRGYYRIVRY